MLGIGLVMLIFIGRLFFIQVLTNEFAGKANRNVFKYKVITPPRGNIYNRYSDIYVSSSPIFDMLITPRELQIADTAALYKYLDMSPEEVRRGIRKAAQYSPFKESIFARNIEPRAYGPLQEQLWNSGGISFQGMNKRYYRYPVGANILGYVSEVDSSEIKAAADDVRYYIGDLIGKSGLERSYEDLLRGQQGIKVVLKDVHNREVGSYANGSKDRQAIKGTDLMLGLDTDLQAFGENLMANKKGSIVAIEPSTGEILAFVSAPTYDPDELTGSELRKNWRRLRSDTLNPLFNRPLMAAYPPGSIFKLAMALAALDEGIITPDTHYACGGGFNRNRGKPGCRMHPHPLPLAGAIKYSCNSYFAATYMDLLHSSKYDSIYQAFDAWEKHMADLGVGQMLHVDLPYEQSGLLPSTAMYDNPKRYYGHNRWSATTIISNAIGQGEILMTPLQMANMVAIIANRGERIQPHFVKATRANESEKWAARSYDHQFTNIARHHYEVIIDAMEQVVSTGTARRAFIEDIVVCGKTGTVQNPHGEDHAVFVGFAPKENPQIAIAVIIENAGGGGSWAAPTASLMIEQYIRRKIVSKQFEYQRILNTAF